MDIIKMNEIQGQRNKRGIMAKKLIKHDNATVMNLNLTPEDVVERHSVPVNVFFYVVSGKGTIIIGDEEAVVKRDDIVTCPPDTEMSLRADQGEEFSVLNVKTPSIN